MPQETTTLQDELAPLFERAEREGLWFHCLYQNIWLSPAELRDYQRQGRFLWSAGNWELADPKEHIEYLRAKITEAEEALTSFQRRVAINSPVEESE